MEPPSLEEYLGDFVAEILKLYENGMSVDGINFKIKFIRVLEDALARWRDKWMLLLQPTEYTVFFLFST